MSLALSSILVFDAAVIHVHAPGGVDVVYDKDGSVGVYLT